MLESIIIQTLIRGGVYALLAVGFSIIFGVARMINLAHTCFYLLAAYVVYTFAKVLGMPMVAAAVLSLVATTVLGLLTYRVFIDRVREHPVTVMLITLALAMMFQEWMILSFTSEPLGAPSFVKGYWEIIGVKVSFQHLLIAEENEPALLEALHHLVDDRELAGRLGAAGRRHVLAHHDWARIAEKLEAALLQLVESS